jgi:hypothetical protein
MVHFIIKLFQNPDKRSDLEDWVVLVMNNFPY